MARYERDFGYGRGRSFGGRYDVGYREGSQFDRYTTRDTGRQGYDRDYGRQWQAYGRGYGQDFHQGQGYGRDFRRGRYGDDFRGRQHGGSGRQGYAGGNNEQYGGGAQFGWGEGPGGTTPGRPAGTNRGYGGYSRNLLYGDVYRSDFGY